MISASGLGFIRERRHGRSPPCSTAQMCSQPQEEIARYPMSTSSGKRPVASMDRLVDNVSTTCGASRCAPRTTAAPRDRGARSSASGGADGGARPTGDFAPAGSWRQGRPVPGPRFALRTGLAVRPHPLRVIDHGCHGPTRFRPLAGPPSPPRVRRWLPRRPPSSSPEGRPNWRPIPGSPESPCTRTRARPRSASR